LTESSCRPLCFIPAGDGLGWGGEVRGVRAITTLAAAKKISARKIPQKAETPHFLCSLIFRILTFGVAIRKPASAEL